MITYLINRWKRLSLDKRIFIQFLFFATILSLLLIILFPQITNIIYLVFLSMPTNSLVPIPHEPLILYYANIIDNPYSIAFWGAIGASVMAIMDYYIVSKAFTHKKIAPLKKHKLFKKSVEYFSKIPFITILIFSTGIIPIFYIIRIIVPGANYSISKYTIGIFLGRLVRFYILAVFGKFFQIPTWIIVLLGLLILLGTAWVPLIHFIKLKFTNKKSHTPKI